MQDKACHTNVWHALQQPAVRAAFSVWHFVWLLFIIKNWKAVYSAVFGLTVRLSRMAQKKKTYGPITFFRIIAQNFSMVTTLFRLVQTCLHEYDKNTLWHKRLSCQQ